METVLEHCRQLPEARFEPGEVMVGEDDQADRMLVLIDGEVIVTKGGVEVAKARTPGALFGEMSALLGAPYSATVTAVTPVRAFVVHNPIGFMTDSPGMALHSARLLAQRLHDATTYLADLKAQYSDHDDHFAMMDQILDALLNQQPKSTAPDRDQPDDPRL